MPKPQTERTLADEDTEAYCLRAMSNTRPERAFFRFGNGCSSTMTRDELTQRRHKTAIPELLPKNLDELIFGDSSSDQRKPCATIPLQSIEAAVLPADRLVLFSSATGGTLGTPGGLGGNCGGVVRDGERAHMV